MHERVNLYLSKYTLRTNTFVLAAEAAQAAADTEEAAMNEYLLRRAEQELRAAQEKVDKLRRNLFGPAQVALRTDLEKA